MHCPFCRAQETKVTDSRLVGEGFQVRRRRECCACQGRFTTYETAELALPRIIKRDASRQPFCEDKLRQGFHRALEKRPVPMERIELALDHIKQKLRATGEREVQSRQLGEWVMEELRDMDDVAFVRFASVYRCFENVEAFKEAIEKLKADTAPTGSE